jgi:hypothetical protein
MVDGSADREADLESELGRVLSADSELDAFNGGFSTVSPTQFRMRGTLEIAPLINTVRSSTVIANASVYSTAVSMWYFAITPSRPVTFVAKVTGANP